MPQPKNTATPSSSILSASGLGGGGKVLTFSSSPPGQPIEDALSTATIEWIGDFANIKIPPLEDGPYELAELATWIEEICEVEIVQFEFMSSTALVRKKRK